MTTRAPRPPAAGGPTAASGPSELRFLLPESRTNMGALVGGAGASWSMLVLVVALLIWLRPYQQAASSILPEFETPTLVYLDEIGPGGGGGGGGNESLAPPKTSEIPKVKPVEPDPIPVPTPEPVAPPEPEIAAQVPAISPETTFAVVAPPSNPASQSRGPGSGGGAGPGDDGKGIGPGKGDGLGPGEDKGTGGDKVYQVGNGIINPTLISSAKPSYTSEAMVRRIEGVVRLECTVTSTGTVDGCEVVKSLDQAFGLDGEALKAANRFRFKPGRKEDQAVAVRVAIEIAFNVR